MSLPFLELAIDQLTWFLDNNVIHRQMVVLMVALNVFFSFDATQLLLDPRLSNMLAAMETVHYNCHCEGFRPFDVLR